MPRERVFDQEGWRRLKGARDLDAPGQAVLRALWIAREERASADDRPPFKVLAEQAMLEIARRRPATDDALARIPGVTPSVLRQDGAGAARGARDGAASDERDGALEPDARQRARLTRRSGSTGGGGSPASARYASHSASTTFTYCRVSR